jgi:hypothetical protein
MAYFTEREQGPRARNSEEITVPIARGLVALIRTRIRDDSFAASYPRYCEEYSSAIIGTNGDLLQETIHGFFPDLEWPLNPEQLAGNFIALDFVEFTFEKIAMPIAREEWSRHESYMSHRHLSFDRERGRTQFRSDVIQLFSANGLAFNLEDSGQVIRLAPAALGEALGSKKFHTGDLQLDALLEAARSKFLSHDPGIRQEGMEKLWDAFERSKTLEPGDKKVSIAALLEKAVPEQNLRARLDAELQELTSIGNKFMIRHTEVDKIPISDPKHVDYLFHRLFAAIQLLLRATGRM